MFDLRDIQNALIGGAMIGAASTLLLMLSGRIAGISGIVGGLFRVGVDARSWRMAFIVGLLLAGAIVVVAWPEMLDFQSPRNLAAVGVGGVLVGFGARLGSGCTSGHGVCGISAGSRRSLIATPLFMGTAVLTVLLVGGL